uniref:Phage protein n=1 Tax=Pseudomonas phage vB_PaeP_HTN1 TaxID=3236646 RepID=A0AB39AHU0_9VIRU
MKLQYNMITSKIKVVMWNELEPGCLYIFAEDDGKKNPKVFQYLELNDEFFICEIFGGPEGDVFFSSDVDCGFFPVTVKYAEIEVHRFGLPD